MIQTGIRIKEAREKAGMSQAELARQSGISRVTIWALETGKQQVTTTDTLQSIAKALNIRIEDIFAPDRTA